MGTPVMHTLSLMPIRLPASLPAAAPRTAQRRTIAFSGSSSGLGRTPGSRSRYVTSGRLPGA